MKTLADFKAMNTAALEELRAMRKAIARQKASIANAGYDAGGNPDATAALKAARIETLRELEEEALANVQELRAIEKETRTTLAGGLGVALSASERAEAAHFGQLYPDPEELSLAELQAQLQAAILHGDRPAMFFWAGVARRRMVSSGPTFGGDTRDLGRDALAGASRGTISSLIRDVDDALRDRSADPVLEVADRLRSEADALKGQILTERADRGEGPTFGRPTKTVKISGDNYSGYHAADDLAS